MNLYALGQRDALAKYGELHALTGRSGGGKSTLAKNLEGNYDLILNTDVGKFVNGRWVRPETSEEREKIRKGIHDKIFAAHNEGKKVLLEGVPNGLLKVLGEDANQAKVFMLPTSHQVALRRAEGRAKERGSDVQQDLESVVAENAKFKRTLDDLKARSASFTKLPAGKKITDLAKYASSRFSTFLRQAPVEKVAPAVESALGSAVPTFYKDPELNRALRGLRTGGSFSREGLVKAMRQRLKGGFPQEVERTLNKQKYDKAFGKTIQERINSPMVKVYHGGVEPELQSMLRYGPTGPIPAAPGVGGRNELAGAFVHKATDPLLSRATSGGGYGARRSGYAGGVPAVLEAEFPEGLLSERGRLGGGESVVPRSLWKYLKNPKVTKTGSDDEDVT